MTTPHQTRNPSAAVRTALAVVGLYRRWISPALPRRCRYYPTCSAYAVEALKVHGALKGMLLAAWRLLRCNPLTRGGVDHVPDPGRWRYHLPPDLPRFVADTRRPLENQPRSGTPPDVAGTSPALGVTHPGRA